MKLIAWKLGTLLFTVSLFVLPFTCEAVDFTFSNIVDTDTTVPGVTQRFSNFSAPSLDGKHIAFIGHREPIGDEPISMSSGVYIAIEYMAGDLDIVADGRTPVPLADPPINFRGIFRLPSLDGDNIAFHSTPPRSIYVKNGSLRSVVTTDYTTDVSQTQIYIDNFYDVAPSLDGDSVAFVAKFSPSSDQGIWSGCFLGMPFECTGIFVEQGGDLSVVFVVGDPSHSPFQPLSYQKGRLYFAKQTRTPAMVDSGGQLQTITKEGVYVLDHGSLHPVMLAGTAIPGTNGVLQFESFHSLSAADNGIAFIGEGGDRVGVYTVFDNSSAVVADSNTNVPQTADERFGHFGAVSAAGDHVALTRRNEERKGVGIYTDLAGTLEKVIDIEDMLDNKEIKWLEIGPEAMDGNAIAFRAEFKDGSQGIYVARTKEPDVRVQKHTSGAGAVVVPGERVSYTLIVSNVGSTDSGAFLLVDELPAGFTDVSVHPQPPCSHEESTGPNGIVRVRVECPFDTLAARGYPQAVTIEATAPATNGQIELENCAQTEPLLTEGETVGGAPNKACTTVRLTDPPELVTTKTQQEANPVRWGSDVTYTIKVENVGGWYAEHVEIEDVLPPGFELVGQPPSDCDPVTGQTLTCTWDILAPGHFKEITITVTASPAQLGSVTNKSCAMFLGMGGNEMRTCDQIQTGVIGWLRVMKSAPDIAGKNDVITYTVTIENHGPEPVQNVQLLDTLSGGIGLELLNVDTGCQRTIHNYLDAERHEYVIHCDIPKIEANGEAIVRILAKSKEVGEVRNVAQASTRHRNPDTVETVVQVVPNGANLKLSLLPKLLKGNKGNKGIGFPPYSDHITHVLTVTNAGIDSAESVDISWRIWGGHPFSLPDGCVQHSAHIIPRAAAIVSCHIEHLDEQGGQQKFTVKIRPFEMLTQPPQYKQQVTSRVIVTSDTVEVDPSDNYAELTTSVNTTTKFPGYPSIPWDVHP